MIEHVPTFYPFSAILYSHMNTSQHSLIVGGSSGIGLAVAQRERELGSAVAILARPGTRLQQAADQLPGCESITCDLTADATASPLQAWLGQRGSAYRLQTLYLAIGGGAIGDFATQSIADFEYSLSVNLLAPSRALRACLPHLAEGSTVLFVNSVAGLRPFPGWSAYSAAKSGLRGLATSLREELRARGIRVISAHPFATDTPLWDTLPGTWDRSRMMRAADVAQVLCDATRAPVVIEELHLASPYGVL